jgi:hypothetical protein
MQHSQPLTSSKAPPQPLHSTPQAPTTYTFLVETPAAVQERLNKAPSRNPRKNKQHANAILFTPNRRNPVPRSISNSPTPAGRSRNTAAFTTATGYGPDEPEQFIQRLNLEDSDNLPSQPGLEDQPYSHSQTAGPLHGRPCRKAPPRPKSKSKNASDVWTFMEAQGDGRKHCLFCKYVKFYF